MNLLPILLPALIPLVTGLVKKVLKTDQIEDRKVKAGINGLIPVLTGVASAFGLCALGVPMPIEVAGCAPGAVCGTDAATCLTVGLTVGTTSGFVRDQARAIAALVQKASDRLPKGK